MSVEPPMVVLERRVCSTREQARELVEGRPDVSPTGTVYVRADQAIGGMEEVEALPDVPYPTKPGVDILTPSFADELLKAWPRAQLIGASDELQVAWDVASEARSPGGGR